MKTATYDWMNIGQALDAHGNAVLPGLLTAAQCDALAALYPREEGYRSRVVMARSRCGMASAVSAAAGVIPWA